MKKAMLYLMLMVGVVALYGVADAAMPVVSNVTAQQRDGTTGAGTIVDITYDVEDADSDSADISIEMSNDAGTTFDVPATTFIGDVGRVEVGTGKSVEWLAGQDVPGEYWDNCQAKVIAEDVLPGEMVVSLPGGATMTMVWIPPGTFMMGSSQEEIDSLNAAHSTTFYSREGPQHEVELTQGFYLGKYELAEGQWSSVMEGMASASNMPKVSISWNDVQALIDTLTAKGLAGFRLPTEAEWEYACRAGTETMWSHGNNEALLGNYAWYFGNSGSQAHEVGTKLPNPWGLHDMHGNVWEWCQDWYDANYYSVSPSVDPPGPTSGDGRVFRGGPFNNGAPDVRSALRTSASSGTRRTDTGARLLRQTP